MAVYDFKIGTTLGGMTNLESLSTPLRAPECTFEPYSQEATLGDGSVRGLGWATATWHWGFMSKAQRNALKAFCAGRSASVFIRTMKQDLSYGNYAAVMVWPQEEDRQAERAVDITIRFVGLTPAT